MKKKLFALVVALTMLLALALPMGAGATTNAGPFTITINAPSSLSLEGQTFEAYKIFDLVGWDPVTGAYDYEITQAFAGFTNYPGYPASYSSLAEYLEGLIPTTNQANKTAIDILAGNLYQYAKTNNITAAASKEATAAEASSITLDVTDAGAGYYMIFGAGKDEDGDVIAAVALYTTDPEIDITLKADATVVPKVSDTTSSGVSVGDTITYTIPLTVPNRAGYSSYIFDVIDVMSEGLTFNKDVVVTVAGVPVASGTSGAYTIDYDSIDNGFELSFNWSVFQTYATGAPIVVTYSALVNQDAEAFDPLTNSAYVKYSNDPASRTSFKETPPTIIEDDTYDFEIYKHAKGSTETSLGGAEFELYATGSSIKILFYLYEAGDDDTPAKYTVATAETMIEAGLDPDDMTDKLITPGSGKIYVKGVAAGTYSLVETKAPDAYAIGGPFEILIPEVKGTVVPVFDIENTPAGGLFPDTGGIGTTIFYIVGGLVMAGAVVTLVIRKRVTAK